MATQSDAVTLEELNAKEIKYYLGGIILMCILGVVGVIGNLHVLFVYVFRMKQSNHRVFIIFLAVLDLITCAIGMPFVVVNLLKPLTFYNTTFCKILTFYNFFICISSAGILIVISVDRYRKICIPLGKQMSQKLAKSMCFLAMALSLLCSWPALLMYGSFPVQTSVPGLNGSECNVLEEIKDTYYPIYFNGVLLFVSFSSFVVLAVLYSIIGKAVWNRLSLSRKGDNTHTQVTHIKMSDVNPSIKSEVRFHSGNSDSSKQYNLNDDDTEKSVDTVITDISTPVNSRERSSSLDQTQKIPISALQRAKSKFDRTKRTTLMLFWITIIFFLSYVPYLCLRIVSYMNPDWYTSMTFTGKVTYNTLLWCVYINNMANCIIYGFCDELFRQEIKNGYKNICRRS